MSSPIYLLLTSADPILTAFQLHKQLMSLASKRPEYDETYHSLADQCSKFATSLLGFCQETKEVETLLAQREGNMDPRNKRFPRLQLAILYEQKDFVVHPSCQQVLRSLWSEGLPVWWNMTTASSIMHCLKHALVTPFLFLCLFVTYRPLRDTVKVPLHRFIYAATTYIFFLAFIIDKLLRDDASNQLKFTTNSVILLVMTTAYFWEVVINIWVLGFKFCWKDYWIKYDMMMYTMFMLTQVSVVAGICTYKVNPGRRDDVLQVFEILEASYSVASIMALFRLVYWYQSHPKLGPLERSIQVMISDMLRFGTLIMLCICAFSIGLNFIYRLDRVDRGHGRCTADLNFRTLSGSTSTLFWALFGKVDPASACLRGSRNYTTGSLYSYVYQMKYGVGYGVWCVYNLITCIVVLNMLVALLSDSFHRVQNNAAREWKFSRSKLWLSHFERQTSLGPPFNLLPSIVGITSMCSSAFRWLKRKKTPTKAENNNGQNCVFWNWQGKDDQELAVKQSKDYEVLVRVLTKRYLQSSVVNLE